MFVAELRLASRLSLVSFLREKIAASEAIDLLFMSRISQGQQPVNVRVDPVAAKIAEDLNQTIDSPASGRRCGRS